MNFEEDIKREVENYFKGWDIEYPITSDAHKMLVDYFSFNNKLVRPIQRKVIKSDILLNKIKQLSDTEKNALESIEKKFINGDNVIPHLSKQSLNPLYSDLLLNDWDIYHLHVSNTRKKAEQYFYDRSNILLFVLFDKDNVYWIDIRPHGEDLVFAKQEFLEIIHRNWIELLYEFKGIIGTTMEDVSDEDIKNFRKNHVNFAIHEIGGKYYAPRGMGYALNGISADAVMKANRIMQNTKKATNYINSNKENLVFRVTEATNSSDGSKFKFVFKMMSIWPWFGIFEDSTCCHCDIPELYVGL